MRSPLFDLRLETVDDLLAIVQEHWTDDLCKLSWLFYDRYNELLGVPTILNPTFDGSRDIGGADADVILDDYLIEIKTTVKQRVAVQWLYQLAGYVLLDYSDKYPLDGVGLYLSRQGLLFKWPLAEFLPAMTGESPITLEELRGRFQGLLREVSRPNRSCEV